MRRLSLKMHIVLALSESFSRPKSSEWINLWTTTMFLGVEEDSRACGKWCTVRLLRAWVAVKFNPLNLLTLALLSHCLGSHGLHRSVCVKKKNSNTNLINQLVPLNPAWTNIDRYLVCQNSLSDRGCSDIRFSLHDYHGLKNCQ